MPVVLSPSWKRRCGYLTHVDTNMSAPRGVFAPKVGIDSHRETSVRLGSGDYSLSRQGYLFEQFGLLCRGSSHHLVSIWSLRLCL
jgi:hypothetical protein